jgi:AcrR family transcriptional regulator
MATSASFLGRLTVQKKRPLGATRVAARRRRAVVAKPKRRSRDDILNRIVTAACSEFKRSGFAGATTAAIARQAGVTEAQLFRYFGSKSNLFRETIFKPVDQHFLRFINTHLPDIRDAASNVEMTDLYATELQRFIREHSAMLASLMLAQTYDTGAAQTGINSLHTYFDRAASLMSQRVQDRVKVDPRLTVRVAFVTVLANVMFKDWIFPAGLASDAEITAAVNDFIKEGVHANLGFNSGTGST